MKNHLSKQISSIIKAERFLDYSSANKLVEDCLRTIKSGGKIIATALGKNVPICEKFIGTLNSIGISSSFLHTNTAVHGDLGIIKNNDLILILSKSGNTEESVYLLEHLMKRKANIWLLTCNKNSQLYKKISHNIVLEIGDEGDPWNIIPNNSSLAFLFFLQALSMHLIDKLKISIQEFRQNHPGGAIGKILNK